MKKIFLFITLITTASAFGAQAHPCPPLPLALQIKVAELKLKKIDIEIAKGPETNFKNLIIPTLGMGVGLFGMVQSGSGILIKKKIVDIHGASLLVSSVIFLVSYLRFNATDAKETNYLEEKKATRQETLNFLRAQQRLAPKKP